MKKRFDLASFAIASSAMLVVAGFPAAQLFANTTAGQDMLSGPMPKLVDTTNSPVCMLSDTRVALPLDAPKAVTAAIGSDGKPAHWGVRSVQRVSGYLQQHGSAALPCKGGDSFNGSVDIGDFGLNTRPKGKGSQIIPTLEK